MELEVFVHGALCIAYSGRCLLSGYFNHRDANQGSCTNACRWEYRVGEPTKAPATDIRGAGVYYLEEKERPGELMPVFEDEHGTYIMNSRDLRAVEHVQRLVEIGVDCLKIEGRTKSHYYTARTTQVYRRRHRRCGGGPAFPRGADGRAGRLANRGYTDGFLQRHASQELQNYRDGASRSDRAAVRGGGRGCTGRGGHRGALVEVEAKNKFLRGDTLELITPTGNHRFVLDRLEDMEGRPLDEVPGGGWRVRVGLPQGDTRMGLLVRDLG